MTDLLKTVDRTPIPPATEALLAFEAAVRAAPAAEPAPEPEPDVPFIEVGGPRPAAAKPKSEIRNPKSEIRIPKPAGPEPLFVEVRFEPVRAAQLNGRGLGPEFVTFHHPDHPVSVQYRSLAAELSAQLPGARPRALLFVAAEGGAGATTVVLNLGITLARQEGTRAVVADAHFARPAVAARFGLPAALGLRDVLVRHTPLAWCLHETLQPSLWALPAGQPDAPPAEAAGPALEQLRARADWVLIDAGPWDAGLAALAEACDAVYLVRRDGAAHERLTATVLDATGRLRGCVVTQRAA